jgi:hypothetical protein
MKRQLTNKDASFAVTGALAGTPRDTRQLSALVLAYEALRRAARYPAAATADGVEVKSQAVSAIAQAVDDLVSALAIKTKNADLAKLPAGLVSAGLEAAILAVQRDFGLDVGGSPTVTAERDLLRD